MTIVGIVILSIFCIYFGFLTTLYVMAARECRKAANAAHKRRMVTCQIHMERAEVLKDRAYHWDILHRISR